MRQPSMDGGSPRGRGHKICDRGQPRSAPRGGCTRPRTLGGRSTPRRGCERTEPPALATEHV
eukprot:6984161-Alexandrium_andersonii.AAC.1